MAAKEIIFSSNARSEIAKIEADRAIARQETDKRIKDALSRREALKHLGHDLAGVAHQRCPLGTVVAGVATVTSPISVPAGDWTGMTTRDVNVAINISPKQIVMPALPNTVKTSGKLLRI